MSSPSYAVTSPQPLQIAPSGHQDSLTLDNTSNVNTVYLSDIASGSEGFPLSPGSVMTWDALKPLYAYVNAGAPVTLLVLDNSGGIFNAGAVASQIIAQGLAGQIASAIAVNGAPPVDVNEIIINEAVYTTAVSVLLPLAVPYRLSVAKYQSVMVNVEESTSVTKLQPLPREIRLIWSDEVGNTQSVDSFWVTDNNTLNAVGYATTFNVAVKSVNLTVQMMQSSQTGTNVYVKVRGSYKVVPTPKYFLQSAYSTVSSAITSGAGYGAGAGNYYYMEHPGTPGVTLTNYPDTRSGTALVTAKSASILTAGFVFVSVFDTAQNTGQPFMRMKLDANTNNDQQTHAQSLIIGHRPLTIQLSANAALLPATSIISTTLHYTD